MQLPALSQVSPLFRSPPQRYRVWHVPRQRILQFLRSSNSQPPPPHAENCHAPNVPEIIFLIISGYHPSFRCKQYSLNTLLAEPFLSQKQIVYPTAPPSAPNARIARIASPEVMPPAAIKGSVVAARTEGIKQSVVVLHARCVRRLQNLRPQWHPHRQPRFHGKTR